MQKTVRELMDMLIKGELHYNQSTQRKFIYADTDAILGTGGKTTKAGSLLHSILEKNIQLPALFFWYNTDTNQLNIHDGKQRLLSIYYFIYPTASMSISTIREGKQVLWDGLSQEDQEKLLNYTFEITERSGNSQEEEESFDLINSNGMPLTPYECTSGMFYGTFLDGFEKYIDGLSKTLTAVKPVSRGEQAYKFLLANFGISDSKKAASSDASRLLLHDALRPVRGNLYNPAAYRFDKIIFAFNDLMLILKDVKGVKDERALNVAAYIVRSNYNVDDVLDYYRQSVRLKNDIGSWDMATHKTFIDAFVTLGLRLDPQRYFDKETKDKLYEQSPRCSHVDPDGTICSETSYSKLEVDHIVPWSKGGRTTIDNATLLCKSHNASKGNRD